MRLELQERLAQKRPARQALEARAAAEDVDLHRKRAGEGYRRLPE